MAEQRHPPWVDDLKQNGRSFWHKHDECIGGSAGISTGGLKPWSTISHLHQGKKRRLPAQRVRDSLERSVNKYRAHGSWLFIGGTTCKERRLSYSCWALSCYRAWKCFLQVSQFHSVEFRLITSHEGRDYGLSPLRRDLVLVSSRPCVFFRGHQFPSWVPEAGVNLLLESTVEKHLKQVSSSQIGKSNTV